MPVSATIAEGVIKIALAGYQALKAQLAVITEETKKLGKSFDTIGGLSSRGFTAARGSILGLVRAADPVRFGLFLAKLEILSIHIGRTFIPILQQSIDVIDRLIGYFANLTTEQRENLLHWTKIGLAVLGAGAALGTIAAIVPKVIGLVQALGLAIRVLASSTGVGLVLVLAGIALGIYEVLKATGKLDPFLERMQQLFEKLVGAALEPLMPVLDEIGKHFAKLAALVIPVVSELADVAAKVFGEIVTAGGKLLAELLPFFAEIGKQLAEFGRLVGALVLENLPLLKQLGSVFGELGKSILSALVQILPPLGTIAAAFFKLWVTYQATMAKVWLAIGVAVAKVLPPLVQIIGLVAEVAAQLAPVFTELVDVIAELMGVVAELGAELLSLGAEVFGELLKSLAEVLTAFLKAFGPDIVAAVRVIALVIKDVIVMVRDLIRELKDMVDTARDAYRTVSDLFTGGGGERDTGAGDFSRSDKGAGGGFDEEGGKDKEPKQPSWLRRVMDRLTGKTEKEGEMKREGDNKFSPMKGFGKVEIFGIEEAFKKAQVGASFDPAKMAENERKKLMQEGNSSLREIADNTKKRPAAESAF